MKNSYNIKQEHFHTFQYTKSRKQLTLVVRVLCDLYTCKIILIFLVKHDIDNK